MLLYPTTSIRKSTEQIDGLVKGVQAVSSGPWRESVRLMILSSVCMLSLFKRTTLSMGRPGPISVSPKALRGVTTETHPCFNIY